MKSKIIIGVVSLVVIALGFGVWLMMGRGSSNITIAPGVTVNNPQTLAALMAAGRPVKCTVMASADNGNMSGTFYIVDKKMRGDYSTVNAGQNMTGHVIMDGNTSYTWIEGMKTGFKMAATPSGNENAPGSPGEAGNQSVDPNAKLGFNCQAWIMDAKQFKLPAGITFTEFGFMLVVPPVSGSAAGGTSGGATAAQCATCNQLPAEYKAQCLASLGCK